MSIRTLIGALALGIGLLPLNVHAQVTVVKETVKAADSIHVAVAGVSADNANELTALLKFVGCDCKGNGSSAEKADSCGSSCGSAAGSCSATAAKAECCKLVVLNARVDLKRGEALLQVAPGKTVKLSEIEKALTKSPFSIDRKRLNLAKNATLHVSGMSCGGCATGVSGALDKVAGPVQVAFESTKSSPVRLASAKSGTLYADAVKAVADTQFKINDVSWTVALKSKGCCGSCQESASKDSSCDKSGSCDSGTDTGGSCGGGGCEGGQKQADGQPNVEYIPESETGYLDRSESPWTSGDKSRGSIKTVLPEGYVSANNGTYYGAGEVSNDSPWSGSDDGRNSLRLQLPEGFCGHGEVLYTSPGPVVASSPWSGISLIDMCDITTLPKGYVSACGTALDDIQDGYDVRIDAPWVRGPLPGSHLIVQLPVSYVGSN